MLDPKDIYLEPFMSPVFYEEVDIYDLIDKTPQLFSNKEVAKNLKNNQARRYARREN